MAARASEEVKLQSLRPEKEKEKIYTIPVIMLIR